MENTMKAVYIKHGLRGGLEYGDCPKPKVMPYEVLIEIHATSVNPSDWKILNILKFLPSIKGPFRPVILGQDVSGIVVDVGKWVKKFKKGDAVYAFNSSLGGAYAEYITIPSIVVAHKPSNMTHIEAAAVPEAGLTGWQALLKLGKMKSGDKVLVIGASGGVGSFSVQIAKALGAKVTGVCSTTNIELVKSLGADQVIDYKKEKFNDVLNGYDIVFDCVGHENLDSCESVLKPDGIFITSLPNFTTSIEMMTTHLKLPSFGTQQKSIPVFTIPGGRRLEQIRSLIEEGKIRSLIDQVYPLEHASEAHEYSKRGRTKGKIVLKIKD
jgi:NADPH:quinone reductase-like Zn-dependent oxidoreductase